MPYNDQISSLIHEDSFQRIIDPRLFFMLKYVIRLGNNAVHTNKRITRADAILSLKNLFDDVTSKDEKLAKLMAENELLRQQMSVVRQNNEKTREFHVDTLTEAETRSKLIDIDL